MFLSNKKFNQYKNIFSFIILSFYFDCCAINHNAIIKKKKVYKKKKLKIRLF